ncbi:hypothetical protein SLS58_011287 [Diplodia intermedia]|uniref:Uncharacterized protein n=1 Tax=Diplodia intermedia TaxID=856260 RepID=A0ABR3SZZ6_9PEZI
MYFIGNSAVSLATLAAVLTAVYAAPAVPPDTFTISDDLANQLDTASKRQVDTDMYTIDDGNRPRPSKDAVNSRLTRNAALSDQLDLAARDVAAVQLDTRDAAPSIKDLHDFAAKQGDKHGDKLLFWTGTGADAAAAFAEKHGRVTLQQVLGTKWQKYQTDSASQGHWGSMEEAAQHFWRPLSRAFAEQARDEVWVVMGGERPGGWNGTGAANGTVGGLMDASRPECTDCWSRSEKPALVAGLHARKGAKVTAIKKFKENGDADGKITHV